MPFHFVTMKFILEIRYKRVVNAVFGKVFVFLPEIKKTEFVQIQKNCNPCRATWLRTD